MYRGQPPRPRNGNGNGHRQRNSNIGRLALARVRARPPKRSRLGTWIATAFLVLFGFLFTGVLVSVAAVATGLAFLDRMESELPDVSGFEQLDYAQPSVVYDRTGTIELARFQVERRRVVTYKTSPRSCSTQPPRSRTAPSGKTRGTTRTRSPSQCSRT